jgi:mRNA-degrading endonuclease YafQ of YafQ-DinJ toxin-antitoxin module
MREIILTVRFKRSLKKFVRRNALLQKQVEQTLELMQEDTFAPSLMVHRLKGEYETANWSNICGSNYQKERRSLTC